jgi:hypothetical protein
LNIPHPAQWTQWPRRDSRTKFSSSQLWWRQPSEEETSEIKKQGTEDTNRLVRLPCRFTYYLLTRTSITCRKRHKNFDEVAPRCANCVTGDRPCIWPDVQQTSESGTSSVSPAQSGNPGSIQSIMNQHLLSFVQERHTLLSTLGNFGQPTADSPTDTVGSEFLTADLASVWWLDLLAADALQANRAFSRAPSPSADPSSQPLADWRPIELPNFTDRNGIAESGVFVHAERHAWQLEKDIVLKDFETIIFRNFVERAALWASRHCSQSGSCRETKYMANFASLTVRSS